MDKKICQYCGNRIGETDVACPVCHRPVPEDVEIPKHPENQKMWKWLTIICIAFSIAFLISGIMEIVLSHALTTRVISDMVFVVLCAFAAALFAFFYKRQV
ncbi:MAG: hypothetical protein Q4F79_12695 [Eubacteriales bacterium]|nr:hypothetical protein [Eubacteriales bacterium]